MPASILNNYYTDWRVCAMWYERNKIFYHRSRMTENCNSCPLILIRLLSLFVILLIC